MTVTVCQCAGELNLLTKSKLAGMSPTIVCERATSCTAVWVTNSVLPVVGASADETDEQKDVRDENERWNKDRLRIKLSDEITALHFPHQCRARLNLGKRVANTSTHKQTVTQSTTAQRDSTSPVQTYNLLPATSCMSGRGLICRPVCRQV